MKLLLSNILKNPPYIHTLYSITYTFIVSGICFKSRHISRSFNANIQVEYVLVWELTYSAESPLENYSLSYFLKHNLQISRSNNHEHRCSTAHSKPSPLRHPPSANNACNRLIFSTYLSLFYRYNLANLYYLGLAVMVPSHILSCYHNYFLFSKKSFTNPKVLHILSTLSRNSRDSLSTSYSNFKKQTRKF